MKFISNHKWSEVTTAIITNTATVTAKGSPAISSQVTFQVEESADLSVEKTSNKTIAYLGEEIIYSIHVENNGPSSATEVYLYDSFTPEVDIMSTSMPYSISEGKLIFNIGSLGKGEPVIIIITVKPRSMGILENSASVSGKEHDPDLSNNLSTAKVTINNPEPPSRGIDISKLFKDGETFIQ